VLRNGNDHREKADQRGSRRMTRDDFLHALSVSVHVIDYLALAVLLGGLLFVSVLWPAGAQDRRTRTILVVSVLAGVFGAIATVLLSAQYATAGAAVVDVLEAPFGRTAAAMALLWLLAAVVVVAVLQRGEQVVQSLAWRVGAAAVAIGLLRTTGMNGHSSETAEASLGMIADFLHLGGVSVWVGGLTVMSIGLLPRRKAGELADVVPKFSKFAMISVLAIVASGLILVWQIIGSIGAIFDTSYGRVLIIKLSVFALVLLAAMKSKNWVEKRLQLAVLESRRPMVRALSLSVGAETVLVVAVLVAASVLVTANPGH
jgi:putative copper export protein